MDAFLEVTDKKKRMPSFGKVGIAAVVGNEDGAHHCHAEIYQALNDVGFTIPACAGTYWVRACYGINGLQGFTQPNKETAQATRLLAANATRFAASLKARAYPGV